EARRCQRRIIASAPGSSNRASKRTYGCPLTALILPGLRCPGRTVFPVSAEPDALARLEHVDQRELDALSDPLGLVHHHAGGVAILLGCHVERDRLEHGQVELGGEEEQEAGEPEPDEVRG